MKTLTSNARWALPAIFITSLLTFAAAAQTKDLQKTGAETPPAINTLNIGSLQRTVNFNISGNMFNAKSLFNIGDSQILRTAVCCNFFAGNARPNNTGSWNAFIGYEAGLNNTSGKYNSFVGTYAGVKNTTGSYNSFVGQAAGYSNISGSYNSFLGHHAGFSNTGSKNSFVGYQAGDNNKGTGNSFVGYQAGSGRPLDFLLIGDPPDSGYSGSANAFLGSNAGSQNSKGSNNAFVGFWAGIKNTTGNNNTFLGRSTGRENETGNKNTFVGSYSGSNNRAGSNITLIGAGTDIPENSVLSYATAIGSEATVSENNTIVLGRSNGSDKVRIFGLGTGGSVYLCRNTNNEISTCSSSLRYKKNVAAFSSGLELVRRLKPIRFEWKDGGMKDVGFGAEDVAAVEPLLVTYNEKGEVEGVKYDRIATVLVNAVKEQQAQIEAQQKQLKEQQVVIEGLKKLLCGQNPEAEICRP